MTSDLSGQLQLQSNGVAVTVPAVAGTMMVSGNMPAFSAYQSVAQTLTLNTNTKIQFQTKEFDTANAFDNATNYRFQPTVAGYYQVSGGIRVSATRCGIYVAIWKNGSEFKDVGYDASSGAAQSAGSALVFLNGSTDYVEFYGNISATQALSYQASATYFQACLVRGA
jgi:hypothetical protein